MATNYELFYQENPHGLGEPTKEFVAFFDSYDRKCACVLDVGCGQGRDALFIARLGHSVKAVDNSPTGIRDLQANATKEKLQICTEVADVRDCQWGGPFDVIVIDRTLHMLAEEERLSVLRDIIAATKSGSHLLIADERRNLPAFKAELKASPGEWGVVLERRGFLFCKRE